MQWRKQIGVGRKQNSNIVRTLVCANQNVHRNLNIDTLLARRFAFEVLERFRDHLRARLFPHGALLHVGTVCLRIVVRIRTSAVHAHVDEFAIGAKYTPLTEQLSDCDWINLSITGTNSCGRVVKRSARTPIDVLPINEQRNSIRH